MGTINSKSFYYRLVCNNVELDLFEDESILISNNITELFDVSTLPSDFTKEITIPGSKKNNAFFEHTYDISVTNPNTFATNIKLDCYIDMGGLYLINGYLQLNNVNINKSYIESYTITLYGQLSTFAVTVNKKYLSDLTTLDTTYQHTLTKDVIINSWSGGTFNGDIIYPLAEYGQGIVYSSDVKGYGIDESIWSLGTSDFKPAIRVKKVWDAIFQEAGYTYTSTFMEQDFLNNVYLFLNKEYSYPIFDDIVVKDNGNFKIHSVESGQNYPLLNNTPAFLAYYSIENNPTNSMDSFLRYKLNYNTHIRGDINLKLKVTNTGTGNGLPYFYLVIQNTGSTYTKTIPLTVFNEYFDKVRAEDVSQGLKTATKEYTLYQNWATTTSLPVDTYQFYIKYVASGGTNFSIMIDPTGNTESYLSVTKLNNITDNKTIKITNNMPFGKDGIKQIDFIKGIQQKFNLVIYPDKTRLNHFIIETFNDWYKRNNVIDFNSFINMEDKIEVIPANNMAVNKLSFGDVLDEDYVSQQFKAGSNRDFGTDYYTDNTNFYSQGEFKIETPFSSSPLVQIANTGNVGTTTGKTYEILVTDYFYSSGNTWTNCGVYKPSVTRRTKISLLDPITHNSTPNIGSPIVITLRYLYTKTGHSPVNIDTNVTIPFGGFEAYSQYNSSFYEWDGTNCNHSTFILNCVYNKPTNVSINPSSVIGSC